MRYLPLAALPLLLAACSAPQQAAGIAAGTTLLQLAAANNTTVATAVTKGALFCNSPKLGTVVALANTAGGIVSVINATIGMDVQKASDAVLSLCQSVDAAATPVPPPAAVPLNSVPVAVAPAASVSTTIKT